MLSLLKAAIPSRPPCCSRPSVAIASALSTCSRPKTRYEPLIASKSSYMVRTWPSLSFNRRVSTRGYQNLATERNLKTPASKSPGQPLKSDGDSEHPTQSEQRKKDWRVIWKLMENVWPKNDWNTRGRVLFGLGLLVGGKVRVEINFATC